MASSGQDEVIQFGVFSSGPPPGSPDIITTRPTSSSAASAMASRAS